MRTAPSRSFGRAVLLAAALSCAFSTPAVAEPVQAAPPSEGAEAGAVRAARAAQNRAMAALDTAAVAKFWTEDVEVRRGLGALVIGRDAYERLLNPDSAAIARGEQLIYQREPTRVVVSEHWPLAYEEGTWVGHLGHADGPALIAGQYAAQWVKRGDRWLIRGEVYVALTCSGAGCAARAVP